MVDSEWTKRRWMEFRIGYSTYLIFLFGFSNFILIAHNFIPALKDGLDLTTFAILFFGVVIPLAILTGHLHVKKQIPTETVVSAMVNPYREKILVGKEEMGNKYAIWNMNNARWNLDHAVWQNEHAIWGHNQAIWNLNHSIWNSNLALKNMKLMNFLLKRFDAPSDLLYSEEMDEVKKWIKGMDDWKEETKEWQKDEEVWKRGLKEWERQLAAWQKRYVELQSGEHATDIMAKDSLVEKNVVKPEKPKSNGRKTLSS